LPTLSRGRRWPAISKRTPVADGDGTQTPDEFVRTVGTTGIPERLCRANMKKNLFVLSEMKRILASLTRISI
jgi:hypothetical protein